MVSYILGIQKHFMYRSMFCRIFLCIPTIDLTVLRLKNSFYILLFEKTLREDTTGMQVLIYWKYRKLLCFSTRIQILDDYKIFRQRNFVRLIFYDFSSLQSPPSSTSTSICPYHGYITPLYICIIFLEFSFSPNFAIQYKSYFVSWCTNKSLHKMFFVCPRHTMETCNFL